MKKYILFLIGLVIVIALVIGGRFYYKNLRGVGPAFFSAPSDIAKQLSAGVNTTDLPLKLPDGFSISVFAKDLGIPRVIAADPAGRLVASIPASGKIVALPDENNDGVADKVITLIANLNKPHGLAFVCSTDNRCQIFVAETNSVLVYDYATQTHSVDLNTKKKIADLPSGGNHTTRTLLVHGDQLLVSVGSSCNVCREADSRRGTILAMNLDGSNQHIYASGLRNSVFLINNPVTGQVWATDMARDLLGDNIPPDEINIIEEGKNYGWPICYGNRIHDTEFDKNKYIQDPCKDTVPPKVELQAHSAPLGLAFIPKQGWPDAYQNGLLVAYHGSWNRSEPTGYKIAYVKFDDQGNYIETKDFITGWLEGNGALGRPVDILTLPNGTAFISDDKAGLIYKLLYTK
jgi:glucose/arabinose dehydrogenase